VRRLVFARRRTYRQAVTDSPRFAIPAYQRPLNALMRGVLKNRVLAKGPGRILLDVHVTGRKSGREYVIPVAYARDGDDLLIATPFSWARNLVDGGRAEVTLLGRRTPVAVRRFDDEAGAVPVLTEMCRQLPTFAAFMKVKRDADGTPDPAAVREAWAAGARAFRLTPVE